MTQACEVNGDGSSVGPAGRRGLAKPIQRAFRHRGLAFFEFRALGWLIL